LSAVFSLAIAITTLTGQFYLITASWREGFLEKS
jgi:hypothetical protein